MRTKNKTAGRNNQGKITIRSRGSSCTHKKKLRIIDRAREFGQFSRCIVLDIQYDPNFSGFLALIEPIEENTRWQKKSKLNTEKKIEKKRLLILAADKLKKGAIIEGNNYKKLNRFIEEKELENQNEIGNSRQLKDIPVGTLIYNLQPSNNINNKGIYGRSAGTYCILLKTIENKENNKESTSIIRLPSKKLINVPSTSLASIGQVSNIDHNLTIKGKAGASRWIGRRPIVRGRAKNPVDHPMGGKTKGSGGLGKPKKTAWGKLAMGQKKKSKK